jgi:hypothetical protein
MEPNGAPVTEAEAPGRADLFLAALSERMPELMVRVRFGAAKDLFDPGYWRRSTEEGEEDTLILLPGRSPSAAIDRLLEHSAQPPGYVGPETAKLDCVEIIEVSRWIALRDVIGAEAFDRVYGGGHFELAAPGSTGIQGAVLAVRRGNSTDREYATDGTPMTGTFTYLEGGAGTVDLPELLGSLPVGSRVMWRNFDPAVPSADDFKNENTIKLTGGRYAAHPFGVFRIEELPDVLAAAAFDDMQRAVAEATAELAVARAELAKIEPGPDRNAGKAASRLRKYIHRRERLLNAYAGIGSRADYIAWFIRIVEVETFVNPLSG